MGTGSSQSFSCSRNVFWCPGPTDWDATLRVDLGPPGALLPELLDGENTVGVGVACSTALDGMAKLVAELGAEDSTGRLYVYLGTASRILPETLFATDLIDVSSLSREDLALMVRRAFDEPVVVPGRRDRRRNSDEDGHGRVEEIAASVLSLHGPP